jgi:hypothetical protein
MIIKVKESFSGRLRFVKTPQEALGQMVTHWMVG